jgi:hypothetical protein
MSSDDAFTRLIARLESEAAAKPRRYRFHVALLAGLGYGYLIALLLMLFAIIGGLAVASVYAYAGASFFVKLAIPVGALAVGLLRALWVKFPEPTGRPLDLARCPALRSLIDDLRHRTRGPIIHKVLFTTEFNASIAQMPRLGPFGAYRNILLIGFPLLLALSPGQFAAVLAHEYGHLASADGRFAGWIYRARQTWSRVALHIRQKQRWGSFLVRRFINWYAPYFNAYSFVLARSNEYAADRWSAEIAGARNTADALVTIAVAAHSLDHDFWPALRRRANTAPLPDLAPCDAMPGFLASRDPAEIERGLTRTLDRKTGLADTHPSLADRLRALGEPPRLLPPAECSAADVLLGEEARALAHDLDADWQAAIRPHWQEPSPRPKPPARSSKTCGPSQRLRTARRHDLRAWRS